MKKLVAEAAGTYGLVVCGTGAIALDASGTVALGVSGIALVFGGIVAAMIFLFAPVSGAHINPAVTIALALSGKFRPVLVLPYAAAQLGGAILASLTVKTAFPASLHLGATIPSGAVIIAFLLEFLLTFLLMIVILASAMRTRVQQAIVIGGVVGLEAFLAGPITGASMNPTRSIGPALVSGHMDHLWLYVLAPICGAMLAVMCWSKFVRTRT